ncbi:MULTISPECIES: hypothetical protein [unclassified Carboxylicivirga]|uniref:hypothetical protein n=1 Tax=Carboxylicivirga TaxID=1628153 RepID=UPI003D354220
MKNAKKFISLYEDKTDESFQKWGYYYPPKTWDEFYAWENDTFEKYLADKEDDIKKTKSYVSLLDTTNDFGFYLAFQQPNYELLNNVLYQTSRQKLLNSGMTASGTDHCNVLLNVFDAFACNDFGVIDAFLPKALSPAKGQFYTQITVNLLKVLYYKDASLKTDSLQKAEKFLSKKVTRWEKYVVLYFVALINQDSTEASICLQELCAAYQKMQHALGKLDNKMVKCFAAEIHGMYRFARVIDIELFEKIAYPEHPCFWEKFEVWQQKNKFPKGVLFYKRPQAMDYMNKLFEADLPTVTLHSPYADKKIIVKDVENFTRTLTENVKSRQQKFVDNPH